MTAWLTSLRDRPIAESERAAAMATVTVLLLAAALLLALSRPHDQPRRPAATHPAPSIAQRTPTRPAQTPESGTAPLTPRVARAADLFLCRVPRYIYGHAPASAIDGATPALLRLAASPSAAGLARHARPPTTRRGVAQHARLSGLLRVSAVVNDGELIDYPIRLLLTPHDGRPLVSALEEGLSAPKAPKSGKRSCGFGCSVVSAGPASRSP